jgi:hypothetical protein
MRHRRLAAVVLPLLALAGCSIGRERPLFELLDPNATGVTFANTITTSDSVNIQTDVYVYNGAGVAVGDVNGDGLPDLYFTGNMVSSRLYLNRGGMKFEDVTARAGVGTTRWATGAAMVDINGDGKLDIYVSVSGPEWSTPEQRANLLFINKGDGTFTEAAEQYGVADRGFSTHAAFLDYDGDGCVDLFVLNNSPQDFSRGGDVGHPAGAPDSPGGYNELYRNDCHPGSGPGQATHFTNVSQQAGILRTLGYGLGVAVADFNRDGRPDIYVSNDAAPNDVLYVNNGDGTFTNKAGHWLKHTSLAGMGVDIADVNDDGWPDIMQVDMMPHDLARRKRVMGAMSYGGVLEARSRGFRQDYSMNSLQLSNGVTPDGDVLFSEIARLAGVEATDWSWAPLFADFDNDGRKDIFIGNGYPKAVNDLDYQNAMFAMGSARRARGELPTRAALDVLKSLPKYEEPSYLFRNTGDLAFADVSHAWGVDRPSLSYGAAYADLDNDGRLDLVVNNIDAPAFIYHNVGPRTDAPPHWLSVRLRGEAPNTEGLGATVTLTAGGRTQQLYESPYRGYMSTVDDRLHFGLGAAARVDSLEVAWPDGRRQRLTNVAADRMITVSQAEATERRPLTPPPAPDGPFTPSPALPYKHTVGSQVDYSVQPLLPYLVSRQGPPIAVGDVDGDGLDDVFVGGSLESPEQLLLQQKDGRFAAAPWSVDSTFEDWGALFFDANGDGKPDLYVASGCYQCAPESPRLQDRLYINQGGGRFVRDSAALPPMLSSKGVVRAADFDGDGRLDLFVGGRLSPREYPKPTRSYILHNEGGRFTDVTAKVAPELAGPFGMVTDARWLDFDGDGHTDLVTVGEWMPITFFRNDGARFTNATAAAKLPSTRGWWYSIAAADVDGDGRVDLVAGNLGLNYSYHAGSGNRLGVYAADFTGNRNTDVVLTQRFGDVEYPLGGLSSLGRAIYTLGVKYPTAGAFSRASLDELFTPAEKQRALHYETDTFASVVLHNEGGGRFRADPLPTLAQIAPVRGTVVLDVDGDGHLDLVVAGNLYDAEPNTPRADAGNGLWLRGDGKGHFTPVPPRASGFLAPGEVSGLALVATPLGKSVLVANTGDSVRMFGVGATRRQLAARGAH